MGQNLDPDVPVSRSVMEPRVLLSIALLVAVVSGASLFLVRCWRARRAEGILVFFGVAWFFVTSSVESSVIPICDVMAEHRAYLPSVGIAVAVAALLLSSMEHLRMPFLLSWQAAVAILVTAGPLGVATYVRNSVWRDDLTLWADTVAKSPSKARPHHNLGAAYEAMGRTADATREYALALALRTREAPVVRVGNASPQLGSTSGDASAGEPDRGNVNALYDAGIEHARRGQLDDAVRELKLALALQPEHAGLRNDLGNVYLAKERLGDAIHEYREAIRLEPRKADARTNLGLAYQRTGRLDEAVAEYREAVRLSPGLATAHLNLCNGYRAQGRLEDAALECAEAIRLAPGAAEPHNNLGVVHEAMGRVDAALDEYRKAIGLAPGMADIHRNLARVLKASGRLDEADDELREARRLVSPAPGRRDANGARP
jgi:Flp pilus assembly protein TadD